ncbi:HAD family hydrolase [Comamonas sp. JC664]|uniref:HAD family hydrolase n=1 Tax=Comamonas sp. JC664 TaxID=2801917 RepID=UPI00361BF6CE
MPRPMCRGPDVALTNRYRLHFLKRQEQVTLFDGVLELLDQLTASATCWPLPPARTAGAGPCAGYDLAQGALPCDAHLGLDGWQAHPLMLQELMAELDVAPERLLMVGRHHA